MTAAIDPPADPYLPDLPYAIRINAGRNSSGDIPRLTFSAYLSFIWDWSGTLNRFATAAEARALAGQLRDSLPDSYRFTLVRLLSAGEWVDEEEIL